MADKIKALSLWQPWASLVLAGHKRIETRSWQTPCRGRIAIHAAKKWNKDLAALCLTEPFRSLLDPEGTLVWNGRVCPLPTGVLLGTVELMDCLAIAAEGRLPTGQTCVAPDEEGIVRLWSPTMWGSKWPGHVGIGHIPGELDSEHERALGDYTPGRFGWLLRDPCPLPQPVAWRGLQSLFEVPADLFPGGRS